MFNKQKKNKSGRTRRIFFLSSILFFILLMSTLTTSYLSKVILSEPFLITLEGLSSEKADTIEIYGYSPFGKIQQLKRIKAGNQWEYKTYSNFSSLYITGPNNLAGIKQICITTANKQINIDDAKSKITNNHIDLTTLLKKEISATEIIHSMFYWKEIRYLIIILSMSVVYLIFLIFFLKMNKNLWMPAKIFWTLFVAGVFLHILRFVFSEKYLISSGLFLIPLLTLSTYQIFRLLQKFLKVRLKMKEIKLTIITVTICLCLIETSFILTGFKSTYLEKRYIYYYSSAYVPEKPNWFHVWDVDHDLKTGEYCYHRTINSEGLSDIEHPAKKDSNEYRIVGLGDSFTEGDGTDVDSTWLKFLERNLTKYPLNKRLTFMNAGVCGSDPYFEYILLKEKLLKFKPDLVLVAVNNSDLTDILLRGGMERFRSDGTLQYNPAPWWEPIYATSHISRLFFTAMGYNDLLIKRNGHNYSDSEAKLIEIIRNFNSLSKQENFKFILIFHPHKTDIDRKTSKLDGVIKQINSEKELEVLNLLTYFIEKEKIDSSNSQNYYWVKDGHHNAKGYAAFARGVEWKLKETGILDSLNIE
jgi:lysophospholipase L1-like esterase